jgi:hypothetical protein
LRTPGRSEKEISKKCLGATKVPASGRRRHQCLGLIALGAGFNPILTGLGARLLFPLTARCSGSRKRKLQLAFAFI